jgi:hypothetical protein
MFAVLVALGFVAAMAVVNRLLRRKERAGDLDPQVPSSAARPGVRRLFDGTHEGWRGDGVRQRPPRTGRTCADGSVASTVRCIRRGP